MCKICKAKLTYSGPTTNLSNHLRLKHKIFSNSATSDTSNDHSKQASIKSAFGIIPPLSASKKEQLDSAIEEFIIDSMQPLSTVEGAKFIKMMTINTPNYKVPSRTTLTSRLRKRYKDMTSQLIENLVTLDHCAITHDAWTSLTVQSYCAITLHFITHDWKLKSLCLEVKELPESHTSENLAQSLRDAQKNWKFPNPIAVTDNAANEKKAFRELKWERISCFGHNLNLAVKAALNVKQVEDIFNKCRKIATYFRKSAVAKNVLSEKQKALLPGLNAAKTLIRDIPTRWNSSFDMLERVCELTPAIHAALSDPRVKNAGSRSLLTSEDEVIVEAVIKVLKPFKDAT